MMRDDCRPNVRFDKGTLRSVQKCLATLRLVSFVAGRIRISSAISVLQECETGARGHIFTNQGHGVKPATNAKAERNYRPPG